MSSQTQTPMQTKIQQHRDIFACSWMEKEDKIMLNKFESLNSTVERLGHEIKNLFKKENAECGKHRCCLGSSTNIFAVPWASSVFSPSRVKLKRSTDVTCGPHWTSPRIQDVGIGVSQSFWWFCERLPVWVALRFDVRWVSTRIRVAVYSAPAGCLTTRSQLASITIGVTWVVNRERF